MWEQVLRPRLHFKEKLSLPALVKSSHRQWFHLRPGCNVGSWNNSDLHCTSRSQHVHVDPGSHRGLVSRFPRWWGFQSILGQPSMDCLGLPSTDLLFPSLVTQRGSEFVGKQVKEWEGLFAPLRRQATSALMVCLSLRTSWSFDAELSLISGLLSYFVWTAGGRWSRKKELAIIIPPLHPNLPTLTTLQAHSIPQMPPG